MRSVLAVAVAVAVALAVFMLAGCTKPSVVTAPVTTDSVTLADSWSGCVTEPGVACSPVSMTLTDSSLTDSSATVSGTGNWGANVTIHGKIVKSDANLDATTVGVLQGWSFSAVLSGNTLAGSMTMPGNASSFPATFTRAP